MKTIELVYSRNPKLVGKKQYEMDSALFSEKVTLEVNDVVEEHIVAIKKKHQADLEESVNSNCDRWEKQHSLEMSGMRIRVIDGVPCPSVTSILNVTNDFKFNPEYALRGQEIENICFDFIDSDKWREPAVALNTITYSDIKYKEFFEKFKDRIDYTASQRKIEVYDLKRKYSGEIDFVCEVDKAQTIIDFKTGQWNWAQLVAYHYTKLVKADQLAIFDFKNCKLEVLKKSDPKYADALIDFFMKRGMVKAIYGV